MHNSITRCHKAKSCVQSQRLSITKKGSEQLLFYSNSICFYYVWIPNIWIQENDNIEETRRPPWNIPWKVAFRKVKKHMALFVLHIKSSLFRAWHVNQFLYVRQWSFRDKDADPPMNTSLKSIKRCLP